MIPDCPPRVVCFDLGGVVVRICRTWREACLRAGLDIRIDNADDWILNDAHDSVIAFQTGRIDAPTFAREVSAAFNGIYTADEVSAIHRAWTCEDYPGIVELIDRVHDHGLMTACLSNTNATHWGIVAHSPAVRRLNTRLVSHELGLHKPDPAIFREAQRRLNVQPREIVFFDDLPRNVDAARMIGWRAALINPEADTASQIDGFLREAGLQIGTRGQGAGTRDRADTQDK